MDLSTVFQKLWVRRLAIMLFLSAIILELLQLTFLRSKPSLLTSPVVWFFAGITTALLGWYLAVYTARHVEEKKASAPFDRKKILRWAFYLIGLIVGVTIAADVYHEIPEINNWSDLLPAKREYIRRLLHGEIVYRPVPFETYQLQPTFLPARWLPFVAAELGGFDYRWISFAALAIGLAVWNNGLPQKGDFSYIEIIVKCILPFLCLRPLVQTDAISLGVAVELLIVGYYLLFTRFLFSRNPAIVALVILLCLLSRYSFLLWLPLLFLVYWQEYNFKFVLRVGVYILLGVLLIYFLPFCLHDNGKHFFAASQYYLTACFATWQRDSWLPEGALPNLHSQGVGFSIWFLLKAPGDLRQKFDLMLQLSLVSQMAITLFFSILYWFRVRGRSRFEVYAFLLVSLKIMLMVFNGLLIAPFSYLFELSFYLSFPLLFILPLKSLWLGKPPMEVIPD